MSAGAFSRLNKEITVTSESFVRSAKEVEDLVGDLLAANLVIGFNVRRGRNFEL